MSDPVSISYTYFLILKVLSVFIGCPDHAFLLGAVMVKGLSHGSPVAIRNIHTPCLTILSLTFCVNFFY